MQSLLSIPVALRNRAAQKRRCGLLSALGLILLSSNFQPASADPLASCSGAGDAAARLSACSAVVAGRYPPAERARAYRIRGDIRLTAGAADDAIRDFNEALTLDPVQPSVLASRANALLIKGEPAKAISDLDAAIRLAPNSPIYWNTRGYARLVLGQPEPSIADFSEAIRLAPRAVSPRNNRGLARMKINQPDAAIEDYTVAIGMNPMYVRAYTNRAYAYESKGLKTEAIADFRRALEIDQTLTAARSGLERLGAGGATGTTTGQLISQGRSLAITKCAWCHATGTSATSPNAKAPPFRTIAQRHPILALREPLTRSISAPHDEMPNFELSQSDIDKIIAYIDSLDNADQ